MYDERQQAPAERKGWRRNYLRSAGTFSRGEAVEKDASSSVATPNEPAGKVLVVLPTYNEVDNIADILRSIRRACPAAEVLVVDDGSPDGTADAAAWVGRSIGGVHLLRRPGKAGLGSAYRAGFAWGLAAGYDVIIEMDADGSHDPVHLPQLVSAIEHGADLAIGSRYVQGGSIPKWGLARRLLSRGGNRYAGLMLGLRVRDMTAGYRAYRATLLRVINPVQIAANGYGFQIEGTWKAARCGGNIVEVPIRFVERVNGESKMSSAIVFEALGLVTLWGLWSRACRAAGVARGVFGERSDWVRAGVASSECSGGARRAGAAG